ncbi:hypothetical protein E2C01_061923 [Portunus trituberculatus]|uniref:Uncharacterized protein n=1 Tax=Portunus trituberculatus TaxID=210409 RepID=A0A5B7HD59_PORTR|nr:hypothetical protein [Portunus trituberculatus]
MLEGVSRRPFGCSSGSYNVRASELARHRALRTLRVQVILLDDSTQVFEIEVRVIFLIPYMALILKHFCVSPSLFQEVLISMYTSFFQVFFMGVEADEQDIYTIKWRNILENPANHFCGLGKSW